MEIKPREVAQFQELYKAKFGVTPNRELARRMLLDLVKQMHAIYQPITAQQLADYEKKNVNEVKDNEQAGTASNC